MLFGDIEYRPKIKKSSQRILDGTHMALGSVAPRRCRWTCWGRQSATGRGGSRLVCAESAGSRGLCCRSPVGKRRVIKCII